MIERASTISITAFIGASNVAKLRWRLACNRGLNGSLRTPMTGRSRREYLVWNSIGVGDGLLWKGSGRDSPRRCTLGVAKPVKLKMLGQELSGLLIELN